MTKTATPTSLIPERFSAGAEILAEDLLAVVEGLNYTASNFPCVHISQALGISGWATGAIPAIEVQFPDSGAVDALRFGIYVNAEVQELTFGVRAEMASGETGDVTITISGYGGGGPLTDTLSFTDADNGTELTTTIDISSLTGDDREMICVVSLELTAGSPSSSYLRTVRLEDVAPALVDPLDE